MSSNADIGFIAHRRSRKSGWDCYAGTPQKAASTSLINDYGAFDGLSRNSGRPLYRGGFVGPEHRGGGHQNITGCAARDARTLSRGVDRLERITAADCRSPGRHREVHRRRDIRGSPWPTSTPAGSFKGIDAKDGNTRQWGNARRWESGPTMSAPAGRTDMLHRRAEVR